MVVKSGTALVQWLIHVDCKTDLSLWIDFYFFFQSKVTHSFFVMKFDQPIKTGSSLTFCKSRV